MYVLELQEVWFGFFILYIYVWAPDRVFLILLHQ